MMEPVDPRLDSLLRRAIRRVSAAEANAAIAEMRVREGTGDRPAASYEVVVPAQAAGDYLLSSLLPRLVYFLDSMGYKLPRCSGLFLSLFHGDHLFFVRAADAVDELSRLSGLSPEEMVKQFGANKADR
jgi:hypothetical protein